MTGTADFKVAPMVFFNNLMFEWGESVKSAQLMY